MYGITPWLQASWQPQPERVFQLIATGVLCLGLWCVYRLLCHLIWRRTDDVKQRYRWRKSVVYAMWTIGSVGLLIIWLGVAPESMRSAGTFLGLLSAGLAIALRDLIADVAGWLFLVWRRPFTMGDRIEIGPHAGDVIDIRVFQFTLLEIGNWVDADQSTGRIVHVPNGRILTDTLANYSRGFQYIWDEVPVLVTFESDWKKAKALLLEIANHHAESLTASAEERVKEAAKRFLIQYTKLTPTVYTSVRESGVLLTIRFLCEPRRRRGSEEAIWEEILTAFEKAPGIELAYPTQRFFTASTNTRE
ncbi:MAG: mechanosensitive ion channel family protein [Lentisphaerae bacterium]|jgi:small-conductance mechanosensitive channel|nr:mechanosensitive ion channel family protein [Lentisphaerota bacterium]MBT4817288.1 mechanosensitive ion channel family protein [Lentisphaerota bacterium]MBT5607721.1 mechanosensitive ion channel family protein [Lentisphaerota bacterium]MBT7054884.1 mechanosensitive ion channel family protein [Lentisphaerota bacterium]MBT7843346.1 mechanosensitive ion channel family protein [Lentisphaerota bacterium]